MKTKRIIPGRHLPTKLPIHNTVLYSFLMYHFNAPGWLWGVFVTVWLFVWILYGIGFFTQKEDERLINN